MTQLKQKSVVNNFYQSTDEDQQLNQPNQENQDEFTLEELLEILELLANSQDY
ncbi:hypothetical protein [Cylindrospermum sp. FACHB-282]|uniref:hypothetical protein n=1 Tax=Cylindrospermum sp. FACHB-282 TaxID=2692794 RepID=UPI001688B8DA|nr:hypothetical protein [Cylindrospermum sp. FACHB-282]MBD2385018.1 hypothetical protein [Cylindrospermum sp. FACHB-282]